MYRIIMMPVRAVAWPALHGARLGSDPGLLQAFGGRFRQAVRDEIHSARCLSRTCLLCCVINSCFFYFVTCRPRSRTSALAFWHLQWRVRCGPLAGAGWNVCVDRAKLVRSRAWLTEYRTVVPTYCVWKQAATSGNRMSKSPVGGRFNGCTYFSLLVQTTEVQVAAPLQ